jgi:hypothetical protein
MRIGIPFFYGIEEMKDVFIRPCVSENNECGEYEKI